MYYKNVDMKFYMLYASNGKNLLGILRGNGKAR